MAVTSSLSIRQFFAMALLEESSNVILFGGCKIPCVNKTGGFDGNRLVNDTWMFVQSESDWVQIRNISSPSARWGHAMASIGNSNKIVLFGGKGGFNNNNNAFKDTWKFDQGNSVWEHIHPTSSPSARFAHAMASLGDIKKVVLFGGSATNDTFKDTLFLLDMLQILIELMN